MEAQLAKELAELDNADGPGGTAETNSETAAGGPPNANGTTAVSNLPEANGGVEVESLGSSGDSANDGFQDLRSLALTPSRREREETEGAEGETGTRPVANKAQGVAQGGKSKRPRGASKHRWWKENKGKKSKKTK
jgi:hypothetical protein